MMISPRVMIYHPDKPELTQQSKYYSSEVFKCLMRDWLGIKPYKPIENQYRQITLPFVNRVYPKLMA